jgi:hypothetical protein
LSVELLLEALPLCLEMSTAQLGVDERVALARLMLAAFGVEAEEAPVRAQKQLARQSLEPFEGRFERCCSTLGICRIGSQEIRLREGIDAADKNSGPLRASDLEHGCPGRTARRMTGRDVCRQANSAKLDRVAVAYQSVDPHWGKAKRRLAARLETRCIVSARHQLGASPLDESGESSGVVPVSVTVEDDLDLARIETQGLHVPANDRRRFLETSAEQDVPVGGGDEKRCDVTRPDVVEIVCNSERFDRAIPAREGLRQLCRYDRRGEDQRRRDKGDGSAYEGLFHAASVAAGKLLLPPCVRKAGPMPAR